VNTDLSEKTMPVDPQVQAFLEELAALRAPPLSSLTPDQARKGMVASSKSLGESEPVSEKQDRTVAGPAGAIPIRVYIPRNHGPLPVLVYFHGGGWVMGDIETHDAFCCSLTNAAGCAVVSVAYRLAPEHRFPAAFDDAYAAARWVHDRAGDWGGDPRRVAIGGDSAGGNLAAAVALRARDERAFRPVLQVLIYPIMDFCFDTPSYRQNADGYMLTRADMRWFWRCYLAREEDGRQPYASPLRAEDLRGLPPALVITAEYDPLRDEGETYAARLREAGVTVTLTRYPGMIHGFIRRTAQFDKARRGLREIGEALRAAFSRP
jgi:acetyl esterase